MFPIGFMSCTSAPCPCCTPLLSLSTYSAIVLLLARQGSTNEKRHHIEVKWPASRTWQMKEVYDEQ